MPNSETLQKWSEMINDHGHDEGHVHGYGLLKIRRL